MPSFNNSSFDREGDPACDVPCLLMLEPSEPCVELFLSPAEAQELLNRVLNSKEEDNETMSSVILKLADAMRESARQSNSRESKSYPAARVA
jgi:hypothetical protein